jgi:hypothetical protein
MKLAEVRRNAFAMPLNDPAYPRGPYKFYNREFIVILSYRPGQTARGGAGAVGVGRRHRFLRIHPHAGLNRLWAITPKPAK